MVARGQSPLCRASAAAPVRLGLRSAVEQSHQRLHRVPVFKKIESGKISHADYRALLSALLRFHVGVERAAQAGFRELGITNGIDRVELLRADLRALDAPAPARQEDALLLTCAEATGAVYAIEGAALGGRVIHKQLVRIFGGSFSGLSFFEREAAPSDRWAEVCNALERYGRRTSRLPSMVAGARASFGHMETCARGL